MRYQCRSCELVIKETVAYCPRCGRPTPHASPDQVRAFELAQWRAHQTGESTAAVREAAPANVAVAHKRPPTAKATKTKGKRERKVRTEIQERLAPARREPRDYTPTNPDDPFHYTACTSCSKTDWLLRTGRNEDGTWRYWCVRCSRSLKTDARIAHGRKPFFAAGGIMTALFVVATII